jgi:hypothetical protein
MSNSRSNGNLESGSDALIDRLQTLIDTLAPQSDSSAGSLQGLSTAMLEAVENQLNDILPMLQFELMDAEDAGEWEQVDRLNDAITTCKSALNAVRAAILRQTVINYRPQDIAEIKRIRAQIDAAARTQQRLAALLQVAKFIRRLAFRIA